MQLTHTGRRFEVLCRFGDGGADRAQKAGFKFAESSRKWYTGSPEIARAFLAEADTIAKRVLDYHLAQIASSHAGDAVISIPAPGDLAFLPFQRAGVAYSTGRRATLNADEPGLGKTIQAIGHINKNSHIKRAAICTPAGLKINWQRECEKWLSRNMSVGIAESKFFPKTDIVLFNYEIALQLSEALDEVAWDLVGFDEAHKLKNPDSKRTQALLGLYEKKKWVIPPLAAEEYLFLTGTPILNRPVELFPMLKILDPEGLGRSYWTFTERYCDGRNGPFGYDASGATHLEELRGKLRGSCMVRRLKRDVLPELPPKRRQIVPISQSTARRAVTAELEFYDRHRRDIEEARTKADRLYAQGDLAGYKAATNALEYSQQILFGQMSSLRHATAIAKMPFNKAFIDSILEETHKLVVFAHHQDVLHGLFDQYQSMAVIVDGNMPNDEKQVAVDLFQNHHKCRLMFMSITAAEGWTLTAASRELFVEFDWRWGVQKQAEDREDRIGQLEQVYIQYLVFDGSLDALMAKQVVRKLEIEEVALDGL